MAKKNTPVTNIETLYSSVKQIIENTRISVYRSVNFEMVQAYWHIGRLVIEEEQSGKERGGYGEEVIKHLSERLTKSYGKGFNERNLWYMKRFYQTWPKVNALRSELSWTHYRLLLKVEREEAVKFYLEEAIEGRWSTRTLERQINSLYYERMIMTRTEGRPLVKAEAESKKEEMQASDLIKDPLCTGIPEPEIQYRFLRKRIGASDH